MSETISKYELAKNKLAAEYRLMSIVDEYKDRLKKMKKEDAYDFIWKKLGDETPITVTRVSTALRTFGILFNRDKGYGRSKTKVSKEDLLEVIKEVKNLCYAVDEAIGDEYTTNDGRILSDVLSCISHELGYMEDKFSG